MGANQSAGRPGNRAIPVRPRTPLRFGSVPTPLPVNPAEYSTRPNSISRERSCEYPNPILSQESYSGSPTPSESASNVESNVSTLTNSSISSSENAPPQYFPAEYVLMGYSNTEKHHIPSVNHFQPSSNNLDTDSESIWPPSQETLYPQHPLMLQRQQILQQQQKRRFQEAQQCHCHYCKVQQCNGVNDFVQFLLPQQDPAMQIQMPLPPSIFGYEDAVGNGMEYTQQNGLDYSGFQRASYSSIHSEYMDIESMSAVKRTRHI